MVDTTIPPKRKNTKRRMTPAQWGEAKALWESGSFTLAQIAERVGSTKEHLSRKFKSEDIIKGSQSTDVEDVAIQAAKQAVEEAVEEEAKTGVSKMTERIAETKEKAYLYPEMIERMGFAEVASARKDKQPLSVTTENLKALQILINITHKAKEMKFSALGLDKIDHFDEEELPELTIALLTEEEIDVIQSAALERTSGLDDGMGGILDEENDIVDSGEFETE